MYSIQYTTAVIYISTACRSILQTLLYIQLYKGCVQLSYILYINSLPEYSENSSILILKFKYTVQLHQCICIMQVCVHCLICKQVPTVYSKLLHVLYSVCSLYSCKMQYMYCKQVYCMLSTVQYSIYVQKYFKVV